MVKNPPAHAGDTKKHGFDLWIRKIPWSRKQQPAPVFWASLVSQMVKNLPAMQETQVGSLGQGDPLRREWHPTPVLLPGQSHGQRSLAGYSSWAAKNWTRLSDTTTNSRSSNTRWLSACCMCALIQKDPRGVDRYKATSQTGKLRPREAKLIIQVTQ